MKATRAAMIAVALVVGAWFALGVRQAIDTSRATSIVSGPGNLDPAGARRADSLLHAAGELNPDRTVDILRAQLQDSQGQSSRAERLLLRVVHSEPMNILAWFALATAATDKPTVSLAFTQIARLEAHPK